MDSSSDEGKLFIGGIGWETTEEMLKDHFAHYGDVSHVVIMRDRVTSRPRGFGFVVFLDPNVLAKVLHETHVIDGRTVEAKKAMSREQQKSAITATNNGPTITNTFTTGPNDLIITKTKKIFVGGLPSTLTEDQFKQYFQEFGEVTDVVIMYDSHTGRPRGFGFITFTAEESVDRVLHKTFHELSAKLVEVKRALPKDSILGSNARSRDHNNGYYSASGRGIFGGQFGNNGFVQLPQQLTGPYSGYGNFGYGYLGGGDGFGYNGYGGGYGFGGYGGNNLGLYSNPSNGYSSHNNSWRSPNLGYGGSLYGQNVSYGGSGGWRNGSRSGSSNGSTRRSVTWNNASKADASSQGNSNGDAERGRTENGNKVEGPLCNGDSK